MISREQVSMCMHVTHCLNANLNKWQILYRDTIIGNNDKEKYVQFQ